MAAEARPNILLIHADQHRFDCLGINGHRLLRTPNLDRLAAAGTNYTHAFTPTPICSPARASLLTGLWPTQHGCVSIPKSEIYAPVRPGLATITQCLHDCGYRVGHVGKFHGETAGPPTAHGVDTFVSEKQYHAWRQSQGLAPKPPETNWLGEIDRAIAPKQSRLAWGADRVIGLIEQWSAGEPFFIRWDPSEPHPPCQPPAALAEMYPPESIEPWPSFADALAGKPYIQQQQRRTWGVDGWTWNQWAPIVSRYLAEITLLDMQVGRLLHALDRLGMADDTLVIYTADHGDLCGGHGMFDKHFVLYDDVVRVPLILRWPRRIVAGQTCNAFISHEIDLVSTILDAAGVDVPESFQGHSLLSTPPDRPDIFAMWQGAQLGTYSQRMVRDRRWKYVWNCTAEDELYDLANDPGELINLATDSRHAAELARLRRRLIEWMESIGDPLLNRWNRAVLESGRKV